MQGLIITLPFGPRNENVRSYNATIVVPAAALRIVNFKAEFRGIARSVSILNGDAANSITVFLNNDRINPLVLNASSQFNMNDMWIEQVELTAGAAGATRIFIEIVPESELGLM